MDDRQLARKLETALDLQSIELTVAKVVLQKRDKLKRFTKLRNYLSMRKCNFRDEQIKKLVGEKNG